jgi:hypothetical protein
MQVAGGFGKKVAMAEDEDAELHASFKECGNSSCNKDYGGGDGGCDDNCGHPELPTKKAAPKSAPKAAPAVATSYASAPVAVAAAGKTEPPRKATAVTKKTIELEEVDSASVEVRTISGSWVVMMSGGGGGRGSGYADEWWCLNIIILFHL